MDVEQIIWKLKNDYQCKNFLGFDQIANDIKIISKQSIDKLEAYFVPSENILLVSFDLLIILTKTKITYPAPLKIKYFPNHPAVSPVFFLQSYPHSHFKQNHSCVRSDGVIIKIPSLTGWRPSTQIRDVIDQIRQEFQKDFPIRQSIDTQIPPVQVTQAAPIQVTQGAPIQVTQAVQYKPSVHPAVLAAEEQAMRADLRKRIDDAKAIMTQRANIERDMLRQLGGDLFQRINYANGARDEKMKEYASMEKVVYDLSERCRDVEKFLAEHPREIIPPERAGVVAMPKDEILVRMITLRARIDGYEGAVTKVENLNGKGENKQIIDAFFLNAKQNFTDIYTLHTMLNQYPDYRKYFVT